MADVISADTFNTDGMDFYFAHGLLDKDYATFHGMQIEVLKWLSDGYTKKHFGKNGHERQYNSQAGFKVSVRCARPNCADFDALVSTIDCGHLGARYGCEAEETALAG